jgi:hypothetical protein
LCRCTRPSSHSDADPVHEEPVGVLPRVVSTGQLEVEVDETGESVVGLVVSIVAAVLSVMGYALRVALSNM